MYELPTLRSQKSAALLGLGVVFTDAYNANAFLSRWDSIDRDYILFHGKFEGKLSITILRNKSTLYKKSGVQIR